MDAEEGKIASISSESSSDESEQEIKKTPAYTIDGKSVEDFTKEGFANIVEATKCANAFPTGTSRSLYSAYPSFANVVDAHSEHILSIINKVIKLQHVRGNIQRRDNDEKLELMLECNDVMLERINSNLDVLAGIRTNTEAILVESEIKTAQVQSKPIQTSWNNERKVLTASRNRTAKLITAKNIIRPQINFKTPVDNRSANPFEPRIKYKPHSLKPLAILAEYADDGTIEGYLHPYEFELDKFEPPATQLAKVDAIQPINIEETPLVYVDSESALKGMINELSNATQIAVDVEHHSYRTFQGITCLLQLSTREKDYIVDALALREELHELNEIFANPKILKVFHGADCDIEWLQRDLSVYVVNMFDTHQAAKRLNFARLSLSFLLKHYCQVDADKSLQLADWRMRPLPEELLLYARQDTHYLLYISDLLHNELLKQANGQINLLQNVYQFSTEVCKRRYVKVKLTPDSHMELYRKSKRIFDNRQLHAFKELYFWRDKIAREEDESTSYVLPNHMMLQIAENLPREMQGILACCNPIPPLVRQHLHVLHRFILNAREQPLVKVVLEEQVANRSTVMTKYANANSHLYCPHDFSPGIEFRDDLPTLLGDATDNCKAEIEDSLKLFTAKPALSVFEKASLEEKDTNGHQDISKINGVKFISPYSRYLAVLPLAEKERMEEIARKLEENRKRKLCPEKNVAFDMKPVEIKIEAKSQTYNGDEENPRVPLKTYDMKPFKDKASSSTSSNENTVDVDADLHPAKKQRLDDKRVSNLGKTIQENNQANSPTKSPQPNSAKKLSRSERKKLKKVNKGNMVNNNQGHSSSQSSNKPPPVEFDYSKVDFKKFQGGSQKSQQQQLDIKSKFIGKGKNNKANKQFNKLFSFSNSHKKK